MIEISRTPEFNEWLSGLTDRRAVLKISARLTMMEAGSLGDAQPRDIKKAKEIATKLGDYK